MPTKILIVDDEKEIVQMIKEFLNLEGYLVYTAFSGEEALTMLQVTPDLILLDVNMPTMDGFKLCRRIRDFISCPILFLSAKIEEQDRIQGLSVGGDDYITKPFSLDELSARITAHLRRERRSGQNKVRFFKDFSLSYTERTLYYRDDEIQLTKTEFDIVALLSLNPHQTYSKDSIYDHLWQYEKEGDSSIIVEHIRRIRQKISNISHDELIETVWGVGYRWNNSL